MLTLLSAVGATACQISAVPGWAFVRWRSVQVRLPPLTVAIDWPDARLGPSDATNATSSSPGLAVLSGGETSAVDALPPCVVTTLSSVTGTLAIVVAVAGSDGALSPPLPSSALTVYV